MRKQLITLIFLLFVIYGNAQSLDSIRCDLEKVPVNTGLEGNRLENKAVYIHCDSLKNGFILELSDSTYRIYGFFVVWVPEDGDVMKIKILGNSASISNLRLLKFIGHMDTLGITCITIEKEGKLYNAIPFLINITE